MMNEGLLREISEILWNPRRCGSAQTAFRITSIHLGEEVNVANYRALGDEKGTKMLEVLRREFPDRGSAVIDAVVADLERNPRRR